MINISKNSDGTKVRVGVLRGGIGQNYNESLETGAYVLAHLPREEFEARDIFVDRAGVWHLNGIPVTHEKLRREVDVVWNALHGYYGEDGKVQQFLENLNIPYIGSGALSSAILANNKLAKEHFVKAGARTAQALYIEDWGDGEPSRVAEDVAHAVFQKFSPPWNVVSISRTEANEAHTSRTRDELVIFLAEMCSRKIPVMVEETVLGREVCVVCAPGFREKSDYTFLPAHVGIETKLKKEESEKIEELARKLHTALMLGGYSKMHAVITPRGHIYVSHIETVPAMHKESELHHMLKSVGAKFGEFAKHLIGKAMG